MLLCVPEKAGMGTSRRQRGPVDGSFSSADFVGANLLRGDREKEEENELTVTYKLRHC